MDWMWRRLPRHAPRKRARRLGCQWCLLLVCAACTPWPLGGPPDKTIYLRLPEDPPRERWLQREPVVDAAFEGVFTTNGGEEPTRDGPASNSFSRLLRKSGVFASFEGPDVAVPDAATASDTQRCRVRLEVLYAEDDFTSSNFAKAALAPGTAGYRFGLESTMRLRVWPSDGDEPIVYTATSVLERRYHHAGSLDRARRTLYDEVDRRNFLAIVHQMRADARLFAAPRELQPL